MTLGRPCSFLKTVFSSLLGGRKELENGLQSPQTSPATHRAVILDKSLTLSEPPFPLLIKGVGVDYITLPEYCKD